MNINQITNGVIAAGNASINRTSTEVPVDKSADRQPIVLNKCDIYNIVDELKKQGVKIDACSLREGKPDEIIAKAIAAQVLANQADFHYLDAQAKAIAVETLTSTLLTAYNNLSSMGELRSSWKDIYSQFVYAVYCQTSTIGNQHNKDRGTFTIGEPTALWLPISNNEVKEAIAMNGSLSKISTIDELRYYFFIKDKNRNGFLSATEIPEEDFTHYEIDKGWGLSLREIATTQQKQLGIREPFSGNGASLRFILTKDQVINGTMFKAGRGIGFNEYGNLTDELMDKDKTIEGVEFKAGTWVTFHNNGKVKSGVLAKDQVIQGIEFKAGPLVEFNDTGKLLWGNLAKDQTIQGITYKEGTQVAFFIDDGKIGYGTLAKNQAIQGIKLKAGTTIYFNLDHKLSSVKLGQDQTVKGVKELKKETWIHFNSNGEIESALIFKDQIFQGMNFCALSGLFFKNGRLIKAHIVGPYIQVIQGVECKSGSTIYFDNNGNLIKDNIQPK